MENKSDLLTADLPVAPSLEQRTQDKQCHTESIFQSSPPKMDVIPDRFKPIRNASFQSLSTVTDSKSISSSSSVKDFTSRQDSKIGQINVYEPLLDPKLQNDNDEGSSDSDSQVDTATEEEYQGKHNPVQAAENEPDVFQGKDVQPVFHPVEKDMVQTNIKTSPITPANIIKKQLINDQHSDKMTIKSKMAKITDIKLAYGKFTNTCYLAKTWLKVAFNTKSKQDDSKAKWKSVDHIRPIQLREYENNRVSRSLANFTGYADLIKETTPSKPGFKTPIYTSQATSQIDFSKYLLSEPSVTMSPQMKDIMDLCDDSFYGN